MTAATLAAVASAGAATSPWWVAPAVLAALMATVVAIFTLIVNGRRARTDRQRVLFAEVFGDIAAYKEFVYIVRRRRHDEPEAERVRISTELSALQCRLNKHRVILKVEAARVSASFDELLDATRRVAGGAIRDGWNTNPITADSNIHVRVDLSELAAHEDRYLVVVADHLSLTPAFARLAARAVLSSVRGRWRAFRTRRPVATATSPKW